MTDAISDMPDPDAPPHAAPERSGAGTGWFDLVSDYVREHPALAAAVAFQIGAAAGVLTRSAGRGRKLRKDRTPAVRHPKRSKTRAPGRRAG